MGARKRMTFFMTFAVLMLPICSLVPAMLHASGPARGGVSPNATLHSVHADSRPFGPCAIGVHPRLPSWVGPLYSNGSGGSSGEHTPDSSSNSDGHNSSSSTSSTPLGKFTLRAASATHVANTRTNTCYTKRALPENT